MKLVPESLYRGTGIQKVTAMTYDASQKLCSIRGAPIPEGRLKVMPKTNVCTTCANEHKPQMSIIKSAEDYGNCPHCGSKLKLRHGPKVDFIGCSGFPSCTYKEWLSRKLGATYSRNNQKKQFKNRPTS